MEKTLSIAIPSYNMEQYLGRCLDSLIIEDNGLMDALDIIVVNDGSKDRTSEIAHQYSEKYPNSIRVIDKENGHYGSCINAALEIANGKYFRILDADDWFDTSGLSILLNELSYVDTDAICTRCSIQSLEPTNGVSVPTIPEELLGKTINMNDEDEIPVPSLYMHQLAYKLDLLKKIAFRHTTGICYTDNEYVMYPLCKAKDIHFFDINLYQYFVGRDDQSMAIRVQYKNREHYYRILDRMISYIPDNEDNCHSKTIRERLIEELSTQYFHHTLLIAKPDQATEKQLKSLFARIKQNYPKVKECLMLKTSCRVNYLKLWTNYTPLANLILLPIRLYNQRLVEKN